MKRTQRLVLATALPALVLAWLIGTAGADDGSAEIGRYQQTAVLREEGLDRVYVTVLDTTTGEVVKRISFATADYEKPK